MNKDQANEARKKTLDYLLDHLVIDALLRVLESENQVLPATVDWPTWPTWWRNVCLYKW